MAKNREARKPKKANAKGHNHQAVAPEAELQHENAKK